MAIKYNNISEYKKFIRENFKAGGSLKLGGFYSYNYLFSLDEDFDKLKFYDWLPITLILDINIKNKTFSGLNFHHMPVKPRQIWLNRVKNLLPEKFESGGIQYFKELSNQNRALGILLKSKIAVRNYRFDRVRDIRSLEVDKLDEVIKFFAKSYFSVSIEQIKNRYNTFRP